MVKKRKRAPGGGRKPNPNKKVAFATRLDPGVMAALKAGVKTWPGENLSTFTEYLINKALREREDEDRNPAIRALNYFITLLAEKISGPVSVVWETGVTVPPQGEKRIRELERRDAWRTDPFLFKAFKFAVKRLLDTLEEPPGEIRPTVIPSSSNITERMRKALASPEEFGALRFDTLWEHSHHSGTLTDQQQRIVRDFPTLGQDFMRRFYSLPKARSDLELKPNTINPEGNND
jgi:hypothetical protein